MKNKKLAANYRYRYLKLSLGVMHETIGKDILFLCLQKRMVESSDIVKVVSKEQVEQVKLILLCVLPIAYPPSFYRSITKVTSLGPLPMYRLSVL
jgi:hypothetical protein